MSGNDAKAISILVSDKRVSQEEKDEQGFPAIIFAVVNNKEVALKVVLMVVAS